MNVKLEVRLFHFNAKSDYLAYYTKNRVLIDEKLKVQDLLNTLEKQNIGFSLTNRSHLIQVNKKSIKSDLTIKEIVKEFGVELTIDPISTYRAIKDLEIDDSDFISKYSILERFANEDDFEYYKSLKQEYYASSTLKYNPDYYGDSLFIFASYLIDRYPDREDEILKVIDTDDGINLYEYEDNVYPKNKTKEIVFSIKEKLPKTKSPKWNNSYFEKAKTLIKSDIIQNSFKDFKIAYYGKNIEHKRSLEKIEATIVDFDKQNSADGFEIVTQNRGIAFQKAGEIALSAYDSGADLLVVDSDKTHYMIDQCVNECQRAVGRDITIPILSIWQVLALASGTTDKNKLGLNYHNIKVELV
jgi:hypothetical protein